MREESQWTSSHDAQWRDPRWIRRTLFVAFAAAVIAGLVSLLLPRSYRATATIMPHSPNSASSSLLGLAASSGLGDLLGGQLGSVENPLLTYPEILSSRNLLERVATSHYPPGSSVPGQTVMKALKIRGTDRIGLDKAVRKLTDITKAEASLRSGLIGISAVTPDSVLSSFVVSRMLAELDRFNVETRSSRERGTRQFVEGRVEEVRRDLAAKEQSLTAFRQMNVRIGNSPQLQLEQARLEREVLTQSELYSLLVRQYEMARIEEKRDTPTFSVVDPPRPPARKYRPRTSLNALIAFFAVLGIQIALAYARQARPSAPDALGSP